MSQQFPVDRGISQSTNNIVLPFADRVDLDSSYRPYAEDIQSLVDSHRIAIQERDRLRYDL